MDHMEHKGTHDPATFDEVIARGFHPTEMEGMDGQMRAKQEPRSVRYKELDLTASVGASTARKNAKSLPADEQSAYKNAVTAMVKNGRYLSLIHDHMDMSHDMHGSMGTTGLYRFLAWHRRYLLAFQTELQKADQVLRPDAQSRLGVPYWAWEDGIPEWMQGFLPEKDPKTRKTPPARKDAPPPDKANAADISVIVTQFQIQKTNVPQENDYVKFTYGLEGWGLRPDGSSLPAHNHGHAWVGGIMNNTSTSPTDPIFWMHHAEVDRIWQTWRAGNPASAPPLGGPDRIMDPWAESYDDLLDIGKLGYSYDAMAL